MNTGLSKGARELADELKKNYNLTDYESLQLALKAEQNEILKTGFAISSSDKYPTGLEVIAISLGYSKV
jgi:hypothetical protein